MKKLASLQQFDPDAAYKKGKLLSKEGAEIVPFEFYPLEAANEESEYAVAYARKLGKQEIADFLEASTEELSKRWKAAYAEGYQREMAKRRTFRIEVHDNLSLSHNGVIGPLDELVSIAVSEHANFLIMVINRHSNASTVAVWGRIQLAFHKAGIGEFENIWMD